MSRTEAASPGPTAELALSGPGPRDAPALRDSAALRGPAVLAALALALVAAAALSLAVGAVPIPLERVARILWDGRAAALTEPALARDAAIVLDIRLPRTLVGLLVGAALASAGAVMQGLFRNPLADPALLGVSSGSALAAAAAIVLGHHVVAAAALPFQLLPAAAFLGALLAMVLLYGIATRRGRTSIATMLLAGIAIAALASAGTGFLAFLSDDRQLRDLTFWTLGSIGGATWTKLAAIVVPIGLVLALLPALGRALNALVLGEAEAFHLGVAVEPVKRLAILAVAVLVGSAVATAGLINFVGLVVPHVVRLLAGPDHRWLLPASGLGGAALVVGADIVARIVVAPAELPIGIVTALVGAPYFLWLLLRRDAAIET